MNRQLCRCYVFRLSSIPHLSACDLTTSSPESSSVTSIQATGDMISIKLPTRTELRAIGAARNEQDYSPQGWMVKESACCIQIQ